MLSYITCVDPEDFEAVDKIKTSSNDSIEVLALQWYPDTSIFGRKIALSFIRRFESDGVISGEYEENGHIDLVESLFLKSIFEAIGYEKDIKNQIHSLDKRVAILENNFDSFGNRLARIESKI